MEPLAPYLMAKRAIGPKEPNNPFLDTLGSSSSPHSSWAELGSWAWESGLARFEYNGRAEPNQTYLWTRSQTELGLAKPRAEPRQPYL